MRTEAVGAEIAVAIPAYNEIQNLKKQGENFRYGGPMLWANWTVATLDGKAHFRAVNPPVIEVSAGAFRVVIRCGKQFNSMVPKDIDANTAASRDAVMMNRTPREDCILAAGVKPTIL